MGSFESSYKQVPDTGVDLTIKKMILQNHQSCIIKCKLKEIKGKNDEQIDINDDQWFIDFIIKDKLPYRKRERMSWNEKVKYVQNLKEEELRNLPNISNYEYDNIPKIEKEKILQRFGLEEISWFYNYLGMHRVLQSTFRCTECNSIKYITMDKTTSKKNINYGHRSFNNRYWRQWKKRPYWWCYHSFNIILKYFKEASNNYNLLFNNCCDFAAEIYYRIEGKEVINNKNLILNIFKF